MGMDVIDLEKRTKAPTLLKKVIQKQVAVENLGKRMRVLYGLQMTRAKENSFLTECKDARNKAGKHFPQGKKTAFLPYEVLSANSYLTGCFLRHLRQKVRSRITVVDSLGAAQMEGAWEAADELDPKCTWKNWDTNQIHDAGYREELKRQLDFAYPFSGRTAFSDEIYSSELKNGPTWKRRQERYYIRNRKQCLLFLRFLGAEEAASGAVRGTAYHKFLELLDFEKNIPEKVWRNI